MKEFKNRILKLAGTLLSTMLIVFAFSCEEKVAEELFEKSSTERSRESIQNLRQLLQSSETGWQVSYKPSKDETGYYQFVFRFLKDSVVEIASDFTAVDLVPRRSEYAVLLGSTTKLSFSTFGTLHKLSDSNFSPIPGSRGAGLKGDFEFLYYGSNAEGDLIFRTNRTQDTVIFKRASANAVAELTLAYSNQAKLSGGQSVYRALQEIRNGNTTRSSFSFPYAARVIQIRSVIETEVNGEVVRSFDQGYLTGYGLTPTGIFLDSVRRSNGQILRNVGFTYNADQNGFQTTLSDGTRLLIGDSNAPIIPATGHKFFLDPTLTSYLWFLYQNADIGSLTTASFTQRFGQLRTIGVTSMTLDVEGPNVFDLAFFRGTASVSNGPIEQLLIYEDLGDRLVMSRNGFRTPGTSVKPENEAVYDEFMDFLTDPEGFYVENLGRATRFSNLVFTFTSVKDPSIRFGLYHVAP